MSRDGMSFDEAKKQLVSFCQEMQNDISRYVYCEKFNVPAYSGAYGDQPNRWIQKSMIIGSAIAKAQKKEIDKKNARRLIKDAGELSDYLRYKRLVARYALTEPEEKIINTLVNKNIRFIGCFIKFYFYRSYNPILCVFF